MKMNRMPFRPTAAALAIANLLAIAPAFAAEPVFELGTIQVTGQRTQIGEIGEEQVASVVTRKDMQTFNRENVADAVNLLPGVAVTNNVRNEKMISVRGYDVRQVPLYIDGIPVYVPYDGYVDFGRFSTFDLAAIQVVKGFSSVAYGPNAIGGAINLISRKPHERLEGDAFVGFGSGSEKKAAVNVGTNQGLWYMQAGVSYTDANYFPMSSDYTPTSRENGGHRENSYRTDSRVSLKLGLTPNATDEYALSYVKQEGEKGQPPSTNPADTLRYWQWPQWDKESVYFLSKTALGQHETLKTRLYVDSFKNELNTYTNSNYNVLKTSGSGSVSTGRSLYDDHSTGGSVELESTRITNNTFRLVTHYRADQHKETDAANVLGTEFKDNLFSISAEDNIQLAEKWLLSLGFAHHELRPEMVYKSKDNGGSYPLPEKQKADNGQIGLFYDFAANTRFYATIAQKTRLPTLKDRYSAKMGNYIPNPNLQPEASINYEIGYQGSPWIGAKAEAALFYSDISDKIVSILLPGKTSCSNANSCQMGNIGEVHTTGIELSLSTPLTQWLDVGTNFTYLNMRNISDPSSRIFQVPDKKFIAYAIAKPLPQVDVIPYIEYDTGRWASNTLRLDGYTLINLKAVYRPMPKLSLEAGVTNLTDKNYELDSGFPNPGRMWFANASYRF